MLWIDDDFRPLRGDRKNFEQFFANYGIVFEPIEIIVTQSEKIIESDKFINAVSDIELDIVLVDYNMTEEESGTVIINHIRKNLHHYHIPIIFYSGDGPQILQQRILESNTDNKNISDGIYFCDKDDIFSKASSILTSLLKKEEKPQRVRGLLMDRVSEIDARIINILSSNLFQDLTEDSKSKLKQHILDKFINKCKKSEEAVKKLEHEDYQNCIKYITDNPLHYDSFSRAKLLREILRIANEDCGRILSCFCNKQGENETLNKLRNDYAHKSEQELSNTHAENRCKYIREETRRHLENLEKLNIAKTSENVTELLTNAQEEADNQKPANIVGETYS